MDVISSRFQHALTQRLIGARQEKIENIATGVRMATSLDQIKFDAGILQGYTDVVQMVEEIEQDLNREKGG